MWPTYQLAAHHTYYLIRFRSLAGLVGGTHLQTDRRRKSCWLFVPAEGKRGRKVRHINSWSSERRARQRRFWNKLSNQIGLLARTRVWVGGIHTGAWINLADDRPSALSWPALYTKHQLNAILHTQEPSVQSAAN